MPPHVDVPQRATWGEEWSLQPPPGIAWLGRELSLLAHLLPSSQPASHWSRPSSRALRDLLAPHERGQRLPIRGQFSRHGISQLPRLTSSRGQGPFPRLQRGGASPVRCLRRAWLLVAHVKSGVGSCPSLSGGTERRSTCLLATSPSACGAACRRIPMVDRLISSITVRDGGWVWALSHGQLSAGAAPGGSVPLSERVRAPGIASGRQRFLLTSAIGISSPRALPAFTSRRPRSSPLPVPQAAGSPPAAGERMAFPGLGCHDASVLSSSPRRLGHVHAPW